jgi:hypothetical protein
MVGKGKMSRIPPSCSPTGGFLGSDAFSRYLGIVKAKIIHGGVKAWWQALVRTTMIGGGATVMGIYSRGKG